jgi:hypothetical protein
MINKDNKTNNINTKVNNNLYVNNTQTTADTDNSLYATSQEVLSSILLSNLAKGYNVVNKDKDINKLYTTKYKIISLPRISLFNRIKIKLMRIFK